MTKKQELPILGRIQNAKGAVTDFVVEDLLSRLDSESRAYIEAEIKTLHESQKSSTGFRKQVLLLMARLYVFAHNVGVESGTPIHPQDVLDAAGSQASAKLLKKSTSA